MLQKIGEKRGCFSGWVLRQAGGAGLLENIVLYGGFVFCRFGWIGVVTIYHVVIKRNCMVGVGRGGVCACQVWEAAVSCVFRNYPRSSKWIPSELSPFIEVDSFGIIIFQPKIFRSKLVDFKSFKSNGLAIYVSRINSPKIFRSK